MDGIEGRPVILVGVGGSSASLAALAWAAAEARHRDGTLRVVRAWQPHPARALYAGTGRTGAAFVSESAAARQLDAEVRGVLGDEPGLPLATEVVAGAAERVLPDRSAQADLLVLGSGGQAPAVHSPVPVPADHPVGPVVRACISHARCPVVIISPAMAAQRRSRAHLALQPS